MEVFECLRCREIYAFLTHSHKLKIGCNFLLILNGNWVPAVPIGVWKICGAGAATCGADTHVKNFRNLKMSMHFQGKNLNFLVKILIFYQKFTKIFLA